MDKITVGKALPDDTFTCVSFGRRAGFQLDDPEAETLKKRLSRYLAGQLSLDSDDDGLDVATFFCLRRLSA
jgi:hypothetical protein